MTTTNNNFRVKNSLEVTGSVTATSVAVTATVKIKDIILEDQNGVLTPQIMTGSGASTYGDFFMNYESGFVDLVGGTTSTTVSGATTSTTQVRYGTRSGYFGSGNYATFANTAFNEGSGDWTWDSWVYINSNIGNEVLFTFGNTNALELQWTDSGAGLAIYSNVDGFNSGYHNGSITVGSWHHIFLMVSGGRYYLGCDGAIATGPTTSNTVFSPLQLGLSVRGPYGMDGYFDMTRFRKDAAYPTSGTYTVPTEASYTPGGSPTYGTGGIEVSTATVAAVKFGDGTTMTTGFPQALTTVSNVTFGGAVVNGTLEANTIRKAGYPGLANMEIQGNLTPQTSGQSDLGAGPGGANKQFGYVYANTGSFTTVVATGSVQFGVYTATALNSIPGAVGHMA